VGTRTTTVVVVGAGPAGLATSRGLTERGIDHVVLERGQVAHSWRTERWDSLRLLTPSWMNALPGQDDVGDDPDGYLAAAELVVRLDRYRHEIEAPVVEHTAVTAVRPTSSGFALDTDDGPWRGRAVVIASGAASTSRLPTVARALPPRIRQLHTLAYRSPSQIGAGGVLVVGASASGVQIADELQRAGRAVTLAVGDHVRFPRTYRGRDIYWWMHTIGVLDERHEAVADLERARRLPSAQLIGTPERRSLDLNTLHADGVEITGRLAGISAGRAQLSGSLPNLTASADLKLHRLLERIDRHVDEHGLPDVGPVDRPDPIRLPPAATQIPLDRFETVLWATGYRPDHSFLDPALLDRRGGLRHDGGVADLPGLYVLGLPFTRRRSSGLIGGIGTDATELTARLARDLGQQARAA
jgi:putative flavoprotein involved in K+ transport